MKMNHAILLGLVCIAALSCGGKQQKDNTQKPEQDTAASDQGSGKSAEQDKNVDDAKKRIRTWLSSDIVVKVQDLGKQLGKDLGTKLASNPEVLKKAKNLTAGILKDKTIKPRLDKIEDNATQGFTKKLTLGWKALRAGGIDEFKQKVGADAQRVGSDVLNTHLQNKVLKDERMSALLKDFSPIIKVQGQMAAIALQENLSPKVTSMILSIALRIAASGGSGAMASRVDAWIATCEDDATARIESLMDDIGKLKSVQDALQSLAVDVLGHERTKKEIVQMFNKLLDNSEVNSGIVKVYEAAAFEKGDDTIRQAMEKVLAVQAVDKELFATLRNLAAAEGADDIIGKNLKKISDDPKLAALIEDFILSILETCGDPSGK